MLVWVVSLHWNFGTPEKKADDLLPCLDEPRAKCLVNLGIPSLKLTWHLKMDGWNTTFLLGRPIFRGYVCFREGKPIEYGSKNELTFAIDQSFSDITNWFCAFHPYEKYHSKLDQFSKCSGYKNNNIFVPPPS